MSVLRRLRFAAHSCSSLSFGLVDRCLVVVFAKPGLGADTASPSEWLISPVIATFANAPL